jgi:HAD superfamily hydrolase (TIGR01509 family)
MTKSIPSVALIGLPNSGKSTLLNRLSGSHQAITAKEAHTTRDLNYAETDWEGMVIQLVDTGGLVPDPTDKIQKEIQIKTWSAVAQADILVWVIDRKQDPDTIPDLVARKVWQTGKPFLICINKVDDPNMEKDISEYARLGGFDFVNVSATNSYGLDKLLTALVNKAKELGFEPNRPNLDIVEVPKVHRSKLKEVKMTKEGKYYIIRENSSAGPGLYQAIEYDQPRTYRSWTDFVPVNEIDNLVFDFFGVIFNNNPEQFARLLWENVGGSSDLLLEIQGVIESYLNREYGKDEFFQNLFNLVKEEGNSTDQLVIDDLTGLWQESLGINQEVLTFIRNQKAGGKKIYYLTNITDQEFLIRKDLDWFDLFDGGVASFEVGVSKPEPGIYQILSQKYSLDPDKTLFIDDREENIQIARKLGWWGVVYRPGLSLNLNLMRIEKNEIARVPEPPKILLLGKPNVGKSSIFNALVEKEAQIVTDIPGTTLSINDMKVERTVDRDGTKFNKQYILLDSTGIRRPGQRTMGVETFATFRTIQTAYRADVLLLVVDGSESLTHQDQVVAGICREAKKGLVVVANKMDLVDDQQRKKFVRDFYTKFKFLKIQDFIWVSAKEKTNLNQIWETIDLAIENSSQIIDPKEVRKLFNYLMKQKPPAKLATKKRAVIYDLLYTGSNPPTFELLLKDKTTVHWSYVRFLENILRQQFDFRQSNIVVKLTEVDRKKILSK